MNIKEPTKKHSFRNRLLKLDKPNLIIKIKNLKCNVDANPDVYSEEQISELKRIINHMSKTILIDKTYVNFKGNRWKDSFIVEDRWYELIRMILKSNFGRDCDDKTNDEILGSILVVAITYLYQLASKFDYDADNIDISFKSKTRFSVEYEADDRTSWNS